MHSRPSFSVTVVRPSIQLIALFCSARSVTGMVSDVTPF